MSCWAHRAWDGPGCDELFNSGLFLIGIGFKSFAYNCPDCGDQRISYFSEDAAFAYLEDNRTKVGINET